jgi:hypothetical protein
VEEFERLGRFLDDGMTLAVCLSAALFVGTRLAGRQSG